MLTMKRFFNLLFIICALHANLYAQSENFENVYKACMLAQSSMSYGEGSQSEIREAANLITKTAWNPLILQDVDVKNEASIKNHLVFSPEFLKAVAENRSVYKKAKKYLEEQMTTQRGGDVQLCTKCIKAQKSVTYAIRHTGGNFNIAAVAEINGLINLNVVVKDQNGNKSKPYKINSDEFKGAPTRKLQSITVPQGNSILYITIENKSKKDKSVAIIIE